MNYLLFFVYLALCCWLLTRIKFIRTTGLGSKTIITLFLLRILAGVVNGCINLYYYQDTDSWFFHLQGIAEYHLILTDPREYFLNIFRSNYNESYGRLFDTTDSYWNDLRSNLISKLLSVFNILSRCNYFINIIFYNFLIFFGSAALYKIFTIIFPGKKNILIICVFLLPSFVYFTSGIHKDGLIFLGLGIICFNLNLLLDRVTAKRLLYISGGLLIVFFMRNFVFLLLIPAMIAWVLAEKRKHFFLQTFAIIYFLFGILFFLTGFLESKFNLPQYVSERQIEFIGISKASGSVININPLFPNFRSFLNNVPQALNHSLMRPYITESPNLLYIPAGLEILFYEILLLVFFLFRYKKSPVHPFIYFGIFFSLSMYLLIGYTIPILGAIVRYRSIYLPFLITSIACFIDWNSLSKKHM